MLRPLATLVCFFATSWIWSADTVQTTHEVILANGGIVRGNVTDESDDDFVVLSYGDRGVLRIARSTVKEVKPQSGTVVVSYSRPKEDAATTPEKPSDAAKDDSPEATTEATTKSERVDSTAEEAELPPERVAEIRRAIYELGRWRTRNRVRAERQLVNFGTDAIDPLIEIANDHPFDLTRRAVFRVFIEVGDERTIPAAVAALVDSDKFVRANAATLLRNLTGQRFGYDPDAAERYRLRRALRWADYLVAEEAKRAAAEAAESVAPPVSE